MFMWQITFILEVAYKLFSIFYWKSVFQTQLDGDWSLGNVIIYEETFWLLIREPTSTMILG